MYVAYNSIASGMAVIPIYVQCKLVLAECTYTVRENPYIDRSLGGVSKGKAIGNLDSNRSTIVRCWKIFPSSTITTSKFKEEEVCIRSHYN